MAAASALAKTVAALLSLFWDVLRLLRSGLVLTFLSKGECRDVAGDVRPDSGTGVLLSAAERSEVLGRIGGGWTASPRKSGGNAGEGESRCTRQECHDPPLGIVGRNEIRWQMRRQRSFLFRGPTRKGWG